MEERQGTIIVTGSSGLIGAAVVERFASSFRVVGLDLVPPRQPVVNTQWVEADFTSDESVRTALEGVRRQHGDRIASVVHLAAYYDFSGKPSPLYHQVTVRGTQRLLRGLRAFAVEQFIFSSTMLVHAPCQPGQRITEDWPLQPKWPYPRSKVNTENLVREERQGIPVVLLRIAGVYDDLCHSIPIARQAQRIYERSLTSRVFPGDPSRGQAFVHLEDVVEAMALAVERRHVLPPETVLLIGEPETMGYGELQRELGRLIHGRAWDTIQVPKPLAKAGAWLQDALPFLGESFIKPWMIDVADDHYELDITRARTLLGWEPRHSLRETLPRMVAALKDDPLRWYQENKLEPPSWLRESARRAA